MAKKMGVLILLFISLNTNAQTPKSYTSSEILLQLKKMNVLGSVLYIAAHPDDENTRLLAYLANEKMYRTGYLSLTRGDGGQNLIGDDQGIDLGLVRTQELIAARRVDGAEQFFSSAFDFGYSKSPDEALDIWGHNKILSDVVWVIRKFKPDVIITRFPTTGEGGHGHHTASAIIAGEAFDAAADETKFPEQLKYVSVWQAKRLLWNTFNFGGNNTTREDQLKIDCGNYNALIGKSYGEIAALSRSQHRSQGFGVPAQRGATFEYFKTIKGAAPINDLIDGIDITWNRANETNLNIEIDKIIIAFSATQPEKSVPDLVALYDKINAIQNIYWKEQKLKELKKIIENCTGLFMEATANNQFAVQGDSINIVFTANNRSGANISNAFVQLNKLNFQLNSLQKNINVTKNYTWFIEPSAKVSQPFWLQNQKEKGSFNVADQQLIGKAESDPLSVDFAIVIEGKEFVFTKPIWYKYTDPVKGEIYEPVNIIGPAFVATTPNLVLFNSNIKNENKNIQIIIEANKNIESNVKLSYNKGNENLVVKNGLLKFTKGEKKLFTVSVSNSGLKNNEVALVNGVFTAETIYEKQLLNQQKISYNHIPEIVYNQVDALKIINVDIKTVGNVAGYIPGAGDKIPDALVQMGYKVITLNEKDITAENLKKCDVVVTGVRAYNTNHWMNNVYMELMQYVKNGGVLFTQYNTSNNISNVKSKIGPYDFNISRNRITDETATVNILLPQHPALNYPNKITDKDFDGWIQERSIYHADKIDKNYSKIFSMKDPGETENEGSLIITNYGKGKFVYTGIVFFRELPAGVPGAYRLFANLIAKPQKK